MTPLLDPTRQLSFHQLLIAARKSWMLDALRDAVGKVDPKQLKLELSEYVPQDVQQVLATAGIRDEDVFPIPVLLQAKPTLVGYYRLLLGLSQKTFYSSSGGMSKFKQMEMKGTISDRQRETLDQFCVSMAEPLAELVRGIVPSITARDVRELPLLALGSQFQGANNNTIGARATREVFLAVGEIVQEYEEDRNDNRIVVRNASDRKVLITISADPDVRIEEEFDGKLRKRVAIEIKGGADRSNAHNRAGEAEKSHVKARREGFPDCWTIIAREGVDPVRLEGGSPSTTSWFDVAHVLARDGPDWTEFKSRIAGEVGIPV